MVLLAQKLIKNDTTKIIFIIIITNISKTDNIIFGLLTRVSPPVYSPRLLKYRSHTELKGVGV